MKVASPATSSVELRFVVPVTLSVPPSVVAPVPTVKVFAPDTAVAPFNVTEPVPVEKVVAPDCVKLPFATIAPPKVAVPVVTVNAFEAVSNPAEVIAPVPVVLILPCVERVPFSLMVKVVAPLFRISIAVPVAPFVLSRTNALAVPALVSENEASVAVSASVNAISRPSVVVIVLPALYACCNVTFNAFDEQTASWLSPFRQTTVLPTFPERVGTRTKSLRMISPDPLASTVRS